MKKIQIKSETSKLNEFIFNQNSITLNFKSGNSYKIDVPGYVAGIEAQFNKLNLIDLTKFEPAIRKEYNNKIDRYIEKTGEKYITRPANIGVKLLDGNDLPEIKSTDLQGFYDLCQMGLDLEGDPLENFSDLITSGLESMFFTQRMQKLNDELSWVKIKTDDKTFKYMYFYTRHKLVNDYEIWYKAIDPIAWFGILNGKAK